MEPNRRTAGQTEYIDDLSFILALKHRRSGAFEQYDVLLDARNYGWQTMLDWADYLSKADINGISSVAVADLGGEEIELIDSFRASGADILHFVGLSRERGVLSVAGESRTLRDSVRIVWLNQTNVLRLFCTNADESMVRRYIESVCRRNFGTEEEMKPAMAHKDA